MNRPSIYIDATHLTTLQATGVELYTASLLPRLLPLLTAAGAEVTCLSHLPNPPIPLPDHTNWLPSPHKKFWSQTGLLQYLNKMKPDLFFTPSGLAPILYKGSIAITIHDMAAYLLPRAFTPAQQVRLRFLAHQNAQHAAVILTPSQYSKQQIELFWHIPSLKIVVTPHGYEKPDITQTAVKAVDDRHPFILYIGRLETKKNLVAVMSGFAAMVKSGVQAQLVLVGKDGVGAAHIRQLVSKLPPALRKRIIITGYVSEQEKAWLLSQATLAIIPGQVEGASFPLLEAFAYGVPVICARSGPLPELAADAAAFVEGSSAFDWSVKMADLLNNPTERTALAESGTERLHHFSWDESASLTATALLGSIK